MQINENTYRPRIAPITRILAARMANYQLSIVHCQLCILLLLTACTRADIHYPVVDVEGYVSIYPDRNEHDVPAQLYHFYPTDADYRTSACDGIGNYEGMLPVGTYQVIASNTSVAGTSFKGMDKFETATVYANPLNKTRNSTEIVGGDMLLGDVYSIPLQNMVVVAGDTIYREPDPILLTHTVTLTFNLDNNLGDMVSGLSGALYGVYPSVHLATCTTLPEEILRSPNVRVGYTAIQNNRTSWMATLHVFGICDPAYGQNYMNKMPITLMMNGIPEVVNIDLTNNLSKIIKEYGGKIPANLKLNIELRWNGIEVIGTVKPWQGGGTGSGEIS